MEKIDSDYRQRISKEWGLTFKPFYRVVAPLTPQRRHASELAGFAALFQWSQRRALLPCIHSTQLSDWIESLNRFREQCSLEGLNYNVSKFLTAQQYITNIIFPWLDRFFLSPWEEIVHWSDQRRHQTSATPFEHETVGSYYSLPSLSARRALHHPYPRAFYPLPSFARIKRQRWRLVGGTQQSTSTISRKKIGYCEQSTTFSNSLTIHQVKTKKITTVKEVHKFWRFYFSVYSFCFDWEDISNTSDSVSSAIQTPRISSKILLCASYFQRYSRCLDIPMKHCRSCLIYYFKLFSNKQGHLQFHCHSKAKSLSIQLSVKWSRKMCYINSTKGNT